MRATPRPPPRTRRRVPIAWPDERRWGPRPSPRAYGLISMLPRLLEGGLRIGPQADQLLERAELVAEPPRRPPAGVTRRNKPRSSKSLYGRSRAMALRSLISVRSATLHPRTPVALNIPPSSRGPCGPRPSLTRTSAINACGSSPRSFAQATVYRWTMRGGGRAKRRSHCSYRSQLTGRRAVRRDNHRRQSHCTR